MTLEEAARVEALRLKPVDLSALADCVLDPTRWALDRLLPIGHVTLLSSHGGAGKSMLAETWAAHIATGRPWGGFRTQRGSALFVSLEDHGSLTRFRLRRICDAYGLDHGDVAGGLSVLDGTETDSTIAYEIADGGVRRLAFTATLDEIETAAHGCTLLVIDNASDAFDGNENERRIVRAFVRHLAQLARRVDCAVLLLAHVDKAAVRHGSSGNSYSGSTAWHNTCRSRVALIESDDGTIELVQEKLNVGRKLGEPIRLEWSDEGVLAPASATGTEVREREAEDDAVVLAAIDAAISDGTTVHAARSGSHSTLVVLKTYSELPEPLAKDKKRFWAALNRLVRSGAVVRENYRNKHRNECVRLVRAYTPSPPDTYARGGCVRAAVGGNADERTTNARTQTPCKRCSGEGCDWCRA